MFRRLTYAMNVYRFISNVYNYADSQKGEIMRTIILSLVMMLVSFPALAAQSLSRRYRQGYRYSDK